jgi:small-conductance mechanosensitive channel
MRPSSNLLTAAAIAVAVLVGWAVLTALKRLLGARVVRVAKQTRTSVDDLLVHLLDRTGLLAVMFVVLWTAPLVVGVPVEWRTTLRVIAIVAITVQLVILVNSGIRFVTERYTGQAEVPATAATAVTALSFALSFAMRLLLFSVLLLLALANLGVDISTLLAGLGVGGIAVALALQSVLKDLLGALTIVINKPFLVGDLIEVGDFLGDVQIVGMRNTRLRNLTGEEVTMPNQHLLDCVVRNHSRMRERRVSFLITVHHHTPVARLEDVPLVIKESVGAVAGTRFDRTKLKRVALAGFEFEIVYHVESDDYDVYAAANHEILMSTLRGLEARGIALAASMVASSDAPPLE